MSLAVGVLIFVAALLAVRFSLAYLGKRQLADAAAAPAAGGGASAEDTGGPSYRAVVEVIDSLLVALALVFFIVKTFVVQAFWIPSGSMKDTLLVKDRVVVNRYAYRFCSPRRGDVVVFKAPRAADTSGKEFIKRLIGLPGDRVHVEAATPLREGKVFVNDRPLTEAYIRQSPHYDFPDIRDRGGRRFWMMNYKVDENRSQVVPIPVEEGLPLTPPEYPFFLGPVDGRDMVVPAGFYLFLGDNRRESNDGHAWGLVPEESLVGRAELVFWPVSRVRLLFSPY